MFFLLLFLFLFILNRSFSGLLLLISQISTWMLLKIDFMLGKHLWPVLTILQKFPSFGESLGPPFVNSLPLCFIYSEIGVLEMFLDIMKILGNISVDFTLRIKILWILVGVPLALQGGVVKQSLLHICFPLRGSLLLFCHIWRRTYGRTFLSHSLLHKVMKQNLSLSQDGLP